MIVVGRDQRAGEEEEAGVLLLGQELVNPEEGQGFSQSPGLLLLPQFPKRSLLDSSRTEVTAAP